MPCDNRFTTVPPVGFRGETPRDRSDAELLAAHVAGDRYAFDELFHRHQRQLHRLARLTSRTAEDAEDALQDAMLSAHRGAGSFRYDAAVASWLHRIVVNACLDRLRRSQSPPDGTHCKTSTRSPIGRLI